MTKGTLGLPLEYNEMPQLFDFHNVDAKTDIRTELLNQLLKKYGAQTVLDLTCGTGAQLLYLARCGYAMTGSDLCQPLVDIAQKRARDLQLSIPISQGDMCTAQYGQFDAVITIFNAIGHLSTQELSQAFKNVADNLKDGGIYIFDILNPDMLALMDMADFSLCKEAFIDGIHVYHVQCSTYDISKKLLTSYDTYVLQENGNIPRTVLNHFSFQLHSMQELVDMLGQAKLECIEKLDFDGGLFDPQKTVRMLLLAQKIK